jgi:hypothetical protein
LTYLRKLWGELYAHAGWDTQLRPRTGWESLMLRSYSGWDATDILV